jgi:uracil-DNA glycosylase family 4
MPSRSSSDIGPSSRPARRHGVVAHSSAHPATPTAARRPLEPDALEQARARIVACGACARLRSYCLDVARTRRAAYRDEEYWGKPVPGFGDPEARLLLLGLAPAAHGANRTGRVFTGDGRGGSGDFLMSALHRAGLANRATSDHADDGLTLRGVYIAAAARCAPPGNKPSPAELAACRTHLAAEVAALPRLRVVLALGRVAWDAWLALVSGERPLPRPRPVFGHGAVATLGPAGSGLAALTLVGCFHPSRQNTHTGRVTPAMYDDVFERVTRIAGLEATG